MLQIKNTLGGGKPEGLYAWKKYKYNPPVTVSNPSITITCPSTYGNKLNITSADIDIKTLWEDLWSESAGKDLSKILTDADGNISEWKSSSGISIGLASSVTSKIGFISKNGTDGISYLYKDTSIETYCAFVMAASSNFSVYAGTYTFNGDYKISDSSVEFLDYIVSDKENAYPDGGEKGGYYYEKVTDGLETLINALNSLLTNSGYNLKGILHEEDITPTGNVTTLPHTYGKTPTAYIVYALSDVTNTTSNYYVQSVMCYVPHPCQMAKYVYSGSNTSSTDSSINNYGTSETGIRVRYSTTYMYFKSGVTYRLIVLA